MSTQSEPLSPEELAELDAAVEGAVTSCDASGLRILGYGEISAVVAWPSRTGDLACKRLPPFSDERSLRSFSSCVEGYLKALSDGGIEPLQTTIQGIRHDDGRWVAYCIQPIVDSTALLDKRLARGPRDESVALFERVMDLYQRCVSPRVGVDGQASNWVVRGDELAYLDVSTPLLRDDEGREQLDTDLFIASLPWALRGVVKRFLLGSILDKYYDLRGVALDFLGNLHKEQLASLIPPLMAIANERVSPAITESEVLHYYRSDAAMWELLQRLRLLDRAWQRRIRRRQYPFLLPGKIERNV